MKPYFAMSTLRVDPPYIAMLNRTAEIPRYEEEEEEGRESRWRERQYGYVNRHGTAGRREARSSALVQAYAACYSLTDLLELHALWASWRPTSAPAQVHDCYREVA